MEMIKVIKVSTITRRGKVSYRYLVAILLGLAVSMSNYLDLRAMQQQRDPVLLTQNIKKNEYHAGILKKDISVDLHNATLEKGLEIIAQKAGLKLVYSENIIPAEKRVSFHDKHITLEDALWKLLEDTHLRFGISSHNHLVVMKSSKEDKKIEKRIQQLEAVSGTVTDAQSGKTLPGVNILVKGTSTGTSTNPDGHYEVSVPSLQDTLVFSFVGYQTRQVPISGRTEINVEMQSQAIYGEEMVVVGYGTQQKRDLTGSVSSVDSQTINDLNVSRVDQALQGQVAGVQVNSVSGSKPGAAPRIRIRGIGSISAGGNPLFVVDGFPTDNIQMLNPNDIKSINILKDASAAAIYGSRGANGVVIITTKRGEEGTPKITLNTYGGWQKVLKTPQFLTMNEQAQYYYDGIKNQNLDAGKDISGDPLNWYYNVPTTIMNVLEGRNTVNSRAFDAIFHTAPVQSYNLSARGGTKALKYSISGQYLNNQGLIVNNNFERYSLRVNLSSQLSKKLSIEFNSNIARTINNDVTTSGGTTGGAGIIGAATTWERWYPLFHDDGSYFSGYGQDATTNVWNPVAITNEITDKSEQMKSLGNLNAEYKFFDALNLKIMIGAKTSNRHNKNFTPKLDIFANVADGSDEGFNSLNWLTETTLHFNKSFNNHNIKALIGYTTQKETNNSNFVRSRNFPNNLVHTLNATSDIIYQGSSHESAWSLISYLGRVNYNYNNKYYLTASLRSDGSSRFGKKRKYAYFPSVALAWEISNEAFLKENRFINNLKIRASYGETGNNNIGNYSSIAIVSYEAYPFGGTKAVGYAPTRFANPSLTWEKQRSFNVGVDASLFKSRIDFTANYYVRRSSGLLLNVFVPNITGFNTSLENIGEVENKGWEFDLSTRNLNGRFGWTTNFNISGFKNKVLKLGPEDAPIIGDYNITKIGQPIGMFYGYKTDGVFKNQAELDAGPIYKPGTNASSRVGDIRFKDISGPDGVPDGVINAFDRTIIGSPYPDFRYGMTNNFAYKNISLRVTLGGSYGKEVFNSSDHTLYTRARYKQLTTVRNWWKSEAEPGDGESPRPNNNPTGGLRQKSSRYLDSAGYFKIDNITLGYTVSDQIADKLHLGSLRIYMTATNPLLITNYRYYNPDVSTSSDPLRPGVFNYGYPLAKTYTIGLNVTF